ncbi:MAG: zinc ABC transporter substrate-binding protein [Clostridiales bacterium]|nr:zinc ABC transporter substrate-binding protein [Clostridiales bacterium]
MKKIISVLLAGLLLAGSTTACRSMEKANADKKKIQIVTTIFPEYDWVMNILGENPAGADITLLLDNGVDLHSYQPTADDIMKISTCDLFIFVGGESDEWVEDVLSESRNKDMIVIDLLETLGESVKEEEVVEGMEHEHDHEEDEEDHDHEEEHDHEDEHDHDHEEGEVEYDEHVWLSLRHAAVLTRAISDALQKIDPDHADIYKKNTDDYVKKLTDLDAQYQEVVDSATVKTVLFGDRFPFRYLTDDYGLSYYAAFVGCSAETEASFETITFLAQKIDELGLHTVMTIEGKDKRIAETIVNNTQTKDQKILTLDSMQSSTSKDSKDGKTYLSIMESNLLVLKEALQ